MNIFSQLINKYKDKRYERKNKKEAKKYMEGHDAFTVFLRSVKNSNRLQDTQVKEIMENVRKKAVKNNISVQEYFNDMYQIRQGETPTHFEFVVKDWMNRKYF